LIKIRYKVSALLPVKRIMERVLVEEGTTRFFVPRQNEAHAFPPSTARIFFNRRMELNRDATILFVSSIRPADYLDAMGATGARGLRVASECGIPVTINDRDPVAACWIGENVDFSGLELDTTCANIHTLLSVRKFDAVDLDPYGSPAPYIDSAIRGTGRFLLITATDTAPLCGAHKKAGIRRYFTNPVNNEYHAETGLRTLLGFVVRETVKYDRGIEPLFCFAREHYVRAHFRISSGAGRADASVGRIGYILQCRRCPQREERPGILPDTESCSACGGDTVPIGPLWLGAIQDPDILSDMITTLPYLCLHTKPELMGLLTTLRNELPTSSYYDHHLLAKQARVSPGPIIDVLGGLREKGYRASRVHYSGTGIKTDAPAEVIFEVMRST
jgi:tRNA (guanine26-N2/guanine27-N2)-dimethyltransferase